MLKIALAACAALAAIGLSANADTVIYSNNFETNTAGFSITGVSGQGISTLGRVDLPTTGAGFYTSPRSNWLGESPTFGLGGPVADPGPTEQVQLSLSGLTAGRVYLIGFDLFIGESWDGANVNDGPDRWSLVADGNTLIDTIFDNVHYEQQRYSDTTFTTPITTDKPAFTGADVSHFDNTYTNYYEDYAIYYFGHGSGNPTLSFTASGPTTSILFTRFGNLGGADPQDYFAEFWALDNVQVTEVGSAAPLPPVAGLGGAMFSLLAAAAWTKRKLRPQ